MEPIMEADSFLEHSVAASIRLATMKREQSITKFHYSENAETYEVEVDENEDEEADIRIATFPSRSLQNDFDIPLIQEDSDLNMYTKHKSIGC